MSVQESAAPTRGSPMAAWLLACASLALAATCGFYWTLGSRAFADFSVYSDFADALAAGDAGGVTVLGPEGFSRGLLRLFRLVLGSGDSAAQAMVALSQVSVAAGLAVAARRREVLRGNLLLAVALYAPLMALVTVRATPAYLVCAAAIAHARLSDRPRMRSVAATGLLALFFHLSAAFVVAGAALAVCVPRRVTRTAVFAGAALVGVGALAVRRVFDVGAVLALAGSATVFANPLLADRLTYFSDLTAPVSVFHLVYFALASGLVLRVLFISPPHPSDRLVLTLFALYCASLVSPVVAFRNSYYLLLPLVVTARRPVLPFGDGVLGQALTAVVCSVLLGISVAGVLEPG